MMPPYFGGYRIRYKGANNMNKVQYVKWLYKQMHEVEAQGKAKLFRAEYVAGAKEAYLTAIDKAKGLRITNQPDQQIIQKAVDIATQQTIEMLTDAMSEVLEDMEMDEVEKTIFYLRLVAKVAEHIGEVMGDD